MGGIIIAFYYLLLATGMSDKIFWLLIINNGQRLLINGLFGVFRLGKDTINETIIDSFLGS